MNEMEVSETQALLLPLSDLVKITLESVAHSPHTLRIYRMALGLFLQYLDQVRGDLLSPNLREAWRPFAVSSKALSIIEGRRVQHTTWTFRPPSAILRLVDTEIMSRFPAWREHVGGDSFSTIKSRVTAVRAFLRVAFKHGVLTIEQAHALQLRGLRQDAQPNKRRKDRWLSSIEVHTLRGSCDTATTRGKRDLAILDMLLYLGLRREEISGLHLSDFEYEGNQWWLTLGGKGHRNRRLMIQGVLLESIQAWLEAVGSKLGIEDTPLFLAFTKSNRVTRRTIGARTIERVVAEYGSKADLAHPDGPGRLNPDDLRRTCARNAYNNGAKLFLIQSMLGHSDPKTTERYIGVSARAEKTAVEYVQY
jgi:integrase